MSESSVKKIFDRLIMLIDHWSKRIEPTTTILFAPTYVTKESAGKKEIHCELLLSVLYKAELTSISGVIFKDPKDLLRLADQLSSNIQHIRRIASELDDRQKGIVEKQ